MNTVTSSRASSLPSPPSKEGGGQIEIVATNMLEPWVCDDWKSQKPNLEKYRKHSNFCARLLAPSLNNAGPDRDRGYKYAWAEGSEMIENTTVPSPKFTQFQQSLFDPSSLTNITLIAANTAHSIRSSPLVFKGGVRGGIMRSVKDIHRNILK